jgi:hypothetical protein
MARAQLQRLLQTMSGTRTFSAAPRFAARAGEEVVPVSNVHVAPPTVIDVSSFATATTIAPTPVLIWTHCCRFHHVS